MSAYNDFMADIDNNPKQILQWIKEGSWKPSGKPKEKGLEE